MKLNSKLFFKVLTKDEKPIRCYFNLELHSWIIDLILPTNFVSN